MTTEVEKIKRKIEMLRTTNAVLSNEIEQMGGVVDLATARVEHFTAFLVKAGIITEEQRFEEQLVWEQGLKPQLVRTRDALRENLQRLNAERIAREKKTKPPIVAGPAVIPEGGPKLIVP